MNSGPLRKCSFEETAEILLEAAFFGEHDSLTGITENIIFGQLAPYGTGSVDLIVDKDALLNCIHQGNDIQAELGTPALTPVNISDGGDTPVPISTPAPGGMSVY